MIQSPISYQDDNGGTKKKIFMAAAHLFAEKGYHGVSMREISESCGVSKPTIYYYFGSKEGIYKELLDAGLKLGATYLNHILSLSIPIKEKLIEITKMRFQQTVKHPEFAKFFLTIYISTEQIPFLIKFKEEAAKRRQMMVALVKEGIKNGEFGASFNPNLAVELILGSITYFIWQQLNSSKPILSDELAEEIIEILFKGLNE